LLKATNTTESYYPILHEALSSFSALTTSINENLRLKSAKQQVAKLQERIESNAVVLANGKRYHILDSILTKKYNNLSFKRTSVNRYHFYLLSDCLLYTSIPDKKGDCKLKYVIPLRDMVVRNVEDNAAGKGIVNAWEILSGSVKSFTVYADTEDQKKQWVDALQIQIQITQSQIQESDLFQNKDGYCTRNSSSNGNHSHAFENDDEDEVSDFGASSIYRGKNSSSSKSSGIAQSLPGSARASTNGLPDVTFHLRNPRASL
jgi:hypothetical protein